MRGAILCIPFEYHVIYREALERSRTVLDVGGWRSYARRAEQDYHALSAEVFSALALPQEV
jgi:hypothetical protein